MQLTLRLYLPVVLCSGIDLDGCVVGDYQATWVLHDDLKVDFPYGYNRRPLHEARSPSKVGLDEELQNGRFELLALVGEVPHSPGN